MSKRKILKFSHWKCFFDKIDFYALFFVKLPQILHLLFFFLQISWERHGAHLLEKFWSRFSGLIFDTRVVSIIFPHFSAKIVKIRGQKYTVFEGKKVKKKMNETPKEILSDWQSPKWIGVFGGEQCDFVFWGWWYLKMVLHNVGM